MTKYLISFPSAAMSANSKEFDDLVESSHQVVREAQAAGVYIFSGGLNDGVDAVLVHPDGTITGETTALDGGFCVLDLCTRAEAEQWGRSDSPGVPDPPRSSGRSTTIQTPDCVRGAAPVFGRGWPTTLRTGPGLTRVQLVHASHLFSRVPVRQGTSASPCGWTVHVSAVGQLISLSAVS